MSCTALITQEDLECTLGRGDVPGDILGSLVPRASASGVLQLEGFVVHSCQSDKQGYSQ